MKDKTNLRGILTKLLADYDSWYFSVKTQIRRPPKFVEHPGTPPEWLPGKKACVFGKSRKLQVYGGECMRAEEWGGVSWGSCEEGMGRN